MLKYRCKKDNIETKSSVCPVCGERTELEKSSVWNCIGKKHLIDEEKHKFSAQELIIFMSSV